MMLVKRVFARAFLIICINVIAGLLFVFLTGRESMSQSKQLADPAESIPPLLERTSPPSPLYHDGMSNHQNSSLPAGAYATLVTAAYYVQSAVTLAMTIKETNTSLQMVALVTPDLSEENRTTLHQFGWDIIEVPPINNMFGIRESRFRGSKVMSKLWLWNLTNIAEKLIYIDADSLVMDNLDHLLQLCDNFCAPVDYIPHGTGGGYWYFSSGMLVLRPDPLIMQSLITFAKDPLIPNWDRADMGLLNRFFFFDCQDEIKHPIKTTKNGEIVPVFAAKFRTRRASQPEYNPPGIPSIPLQTQSRPMVRCQSLPLQYNIKGGAMPPILNPVPKIIHFFDDQKAHHCLDIKKAPILFLRYLKKHPNFCTEHPYVLLFKSYLRKAGMLE